MKLEPADFDRGVHDFRGSSWGSAGVRGGARRALRGARVGSWVCIVMYWKVFEGFRRILMDLRGAAGAKWRCEHLEDVSQEVPNPPKSPGPGGEGGSARGGAGGSRRWAGAVYVCACECF